MAWAVENHPRRPPSYNPAFLKTSCHSKCLQKADSNHILTRAKAVKSTFLAADEQEAGHEQPNPTLTHVPWGASRHCDPVLFLPLVTMAPALKPFPRPGSHNVTFYQVI